MTKKLPMNITFMSRGMACVTCVLNNNVFPDPVKKLAGVVEKRLAILVHNAQRVRSAVLHEVHDFQMQIVAHWRHFHGLSQEHEWQVVAERTESNAALQSVLFEFKAFLDLYARLIVALFKLTGVKGQVDSFGKSIVNGSELSGRKADQLASEPIIQDEP